MLNDKKKSLAVIVFVFSLLQKEKRGGAMRPWRTPRCARKPETGGIEKPYRFACCDVSTIFKFVSLFFFTQRFMMQRYKIKEEEKRPRKKRIEGALFFLYF